MPTRSAPSTRSARISAGVSKCGPGSPAYTPSARPGSTARANSRNRASYGDPAAAGVPARAVRSSWSASSTGSPTANPGRIPPAALVSRTVPQPAATAVRTPWVTVSAGWPS